MSEDNTTGKDSDSSNVVPLFGNPKAVPALADPSWGSTGFDANAFTIETPKGGGLSDILDAIVNSSSNKDDDGFDMTLSTNRRMYFGETSHSSLDIEACKIETTLFLMEDMSTSLQLNTLVTRDDALWDATVELQKCITKLLTRNKEILDSSEETDEQ